MAEDPTPKAGDAGRKGNFVGATSALLLSAAGFIALGMPRSSWGVAWPTAAAEFGRPVAELGYLLTAFVGVYAAATMVSGRLVIRHGTGQVLAVGAGLGAAALLMLAVAPTALLAVAALAVVGFSGGLIDSSVNSHVALHHGARAMGMLHAAYGIGATLGPLIVTFTVTIGSSWRPAMAVFAVVHGAVALGLFATISRFGHGMVLGHSYLPTTGTRRVVVLALTMFALLTAVESAASQFGYSLLTIGRGIDETMAGVAISLFFAGMTISRIGLGLLGHKADPARIITAATMVVLAGAALFWWAPSPVAGAVGLAIMGFGGGPLFPLSVLLTPRRVGTAATPRVVGWQLAAANVGSAIFPALMAVLIGRQGLGVIAPAVLVSAMALALVAHLLRRHTGDAPVANIQAPAGL